MKRLIEILGIVVCVILLNSCTTSQKVTVQGTPGTEIYSPTMERLGIVGPNGKVSFKISRHSYYSYLMSKNAGANELVPFALDYKHCNNTLAAAASWLGMSLAGAGALMGGISVAVGGDTPEITAIGAAMLGAGLLMAIPSTSYFKKTHEFDEFKYLKYQKTNQDFSFLPIKDMGYVKTMQDNDNMVITPHVSDKANNGSSSSTATRRKSSVSKRTLNDNAKLVSGSYFGTGYLTQKGKVIEEYAKIKVVILRIDNNNVNVDVFENGESYFSKTNKYQVMKKGKNTYVLSLDGISDALITIDNAGHLTYIHPKVNIDGEIYTLNLTANKK